MPKRLIPATIALGSFTFTMTALPGTPQIQNAIPAPFFGTDAFAAPGLGIIAALIMFGGGTGYLMYRAKRLTAAGETYLPPERPGNGGIVQPLLQEVEQRRLRHRRRRGSARASAPPTAAARPPPPARPVAA